MGYCTLEDLKSTGLTETKLIQLTNDGKADTINLTVLENAIQAAEAMINGFVANRYAGALPLQTVPPQLVTIATLLTKYFLYELKSAVDEKIQKMYDNQVSLLKKISNGTFKLLELETTAPVQSDGVQFTNKTPADRVFASPEGYFT